MKTKIYCKDSNGDNLIISIKLADDCKNGHDDFSITADCYKAGKPKTDRYYLYGGCCHEEILKVRPDLQIFVNLHLCNYKGVPMHCLDNGYYHLQNNFEHLISEFRLTGEEAEYFRNCPDKQYFAYLMLKLNLPEKWQNEASEAIQILETLTGEKYVPKENQKENYVPTPGIEENVEQLIKEDYYLPETITKRKEEERLNRLDVKIRELRRDKENSIKKAINEYNVNVAVLNTGLSIDNFIYYNHSNEGVFNWNTSSFNKAVTPEEFEEFLKVVNYDNLPEGIIFKLK